MGQIKSYPENTSVDDSDLFLTQDSSDNTEKVAADTLKAYMLDDTEFREIARTTLTGAGDTITVSSIPARRYLRVIIHVIPSGNVNTNIKYNNDSGANYAENFYDIVPSSATPTMTTGRNVSNTLANLEVGNGTWQEFIQIDIINYATLEKLAKVQNIVGNTAGAATAPIINTFYHKWVNTTDQISRIDITNAGTGDFAADSEAIVYGHN